jgi:Tol biopolymer transport system component
MDYIRSLAWAPDGSGILVSGQGHLGRSVDGGVLFVGPDSRRVYVVRSDGSGSRMLDAGPGMTASDASWRPDGRHIAFMGWQGGTDDHVAGVFVADADGSNVHRLAIDPGPEAHGVAWSPDGTRLSFLSTGGTTDGVPTIADIDADGDLTGSHVASLDPGSSARSAPQWSSDGSHLAALLQDGAGLRVGIFEPDGSGLRVVGPAVGGGWDADLAWSPDGRSVAITGSVLGLDPVAQVMRWAEKTWSVDVATGEQTEVRTPVESWQRSAP